MIGPINGIPSTGIVTSDSYMVGDGLATTGGYVLGGTDNTTGFQNALKAAANSQSRTLVINAPLGKTLTAGPLVVGRVYRITTFAAGDNFNVCGGGSDTNGNPLQSTFVATGTTPGTWTNESVLQEVLGTYRIDGDIVVPEGVFIDSGAAPGDIGGPGPWAGNAFAVRLGLTKLYGTALYLPIVSSNIIRGIEVFGHCECGLGVGGTMIVNTTTHGNTTVECTGVNAYRFTVGMKVINAPGRTDFAGGTTVTAISGAPVRLVATTTSSSASITMPSTTGITTGMTVTGQGIVQGTTVSSITGTGPFTVGLNNACNASVTNVMTFTRADGKITLTLSAAASGSNTLSDALAPQFNDPLYPGTIFTLQPGSNVVTEWCYIHGFGVPLESNYNVYGRVSDCLIQNFQLAGMRIENGVDNEIERVQIGNNNDYTPAPFGFSLSGQYSPTKLKKISLFNCLRNFDIAGATISVNDINTQGVVGSVCIDVRGGGITGDGFVYGTGGQCVLVRLHDGTITFTNLNGPGAASVSTGTSSSTSLSVNTTGLIVGMAVTGSGIPSGTWITAITPGSPGTVTINNSATASATVTLAYTSPLVQSTQANSVDLRPIDSNAFVQVINGNTFIPTAQTIAGASAGALTHDNISLTGTISTLGNNAISAGGNLMVGTATGDGSGINIGGEVWVLAESGGTGRWFTNSFGGPGALVYALPSSDPHVVGAPWNNSGLVVVSSG